MTLNLLRQLLKMLSAAWIGARNTVAEGLLWALRALATCLIALICLLALFVACAVTLLDMLSIPKRKDSTQVKKDFQAPGG